MILSMVRRISNNANDLNIRWQLEGKNWHSRERERGKWKKQPWTKSQSARIAVYKFPSKSLTGENEENYLSSLTYR